MRDIAIFMAAASAVIAMTDLASAANANNCVLKVDEKTYLEGDCSFSDDGTEVSISPMDTEGDRHRARLERLPDGSANAWWNGPTAGISLNVDLGRLERRGRTCWAGDRARVCFSPVGEEELTYPEDGESETVAEGDDAPGEGVAPNFGSAFDSAETTSMTCIFAAEVLLSPDRRMMARGMGGQSYTGHIPRVHEFTFDGGQTVIFSGTPFKVIWQDGSKIAIPTLAQVSASSLMPGLSGEQAADLQRGLDRMRELQGSASGLDQRVIVLDFDASEAVVATVSGNQLTERQPLRCQ